MPATAITRLGQPHHHHNDANTNQRLLMTTSNSTCDKFYNLPEECHCVALPRHQIKIQCLKQFDDLALNDTLGIVLDLDICNVQGSTMSLDLVELNHNIHYTVSQIKAGESAVYPIPGWSVIVPGLGHVGLDIAVLLEGNPDMLEAKIGLDACVVTPTHQVCAENIPGLNYILPWYILQGNYTFGDYCETLQQAAEDENPSIANNNNNNNGNQLASS